MGLNERLKRKIYCKNGNIVRRDIADEIILVPIRGNLADLQKIFALDTVADFIWLQLDGQQGCEEILTALLSAFAVDGDQAAEDLDEFINALLEADLICEVI